VIPRPTQHKKGEHDAALSQDPAPDAFARLVSTTQYPSSEVAGTAASVTDGKRNGFELPTLAPGVERRTFPSYGVVAPPGAGSMLHLEPDEYELLDLMDGHHSRAEIECAAGDPIDELLNDLWDEGFLVGASQPTEKKVTVTLHGVEFSGFDRIVQALNRRIGAFLFSIPAAVILGVLGLVGLTLFFAQVANGQRLTVSTATPVLAVVALRILGLAAIGPHETGHALVLAHNGRRIGRVGVGFYWGALTFYVDASQALFLPQRTRLLQSSAGVLSDFVVCGCASVAAIAGGESAWAVVLREFVVLGYLNIIINAVPLLELDGYWFLADWLERPTLQRDARQALTATLQRQPVANYRLALYAAVSIVFGVGLVLLGFAAWWGLFGGLFRTLWDGGIGYKALAFYLLLPFIPIVIHLVAQPFRHRRSSKES
jgi:putative peptide zinc metalloprotease protein